MSAQVPTARLAGFYFSNFLILGLFLPFWPVYLESQGFSAVEIGELLAVMLATRIVAPNFWGWVADHQGQPVRLIQLTSVLALLSFLPIYWGTSFWHLALILAAMGWFWNAALPQFEVVTLQLLGQRTEDYGRLRAWGSVGFIAAVMLGGQYLGQLGYQRMPDLVVFGLASMIVAAFCLPKVTLPRVAKPKGHLRSVLSQKPVMALLAVICLMQISHAVYYTFFSLWMQESGYSGKAISAFWALGVIAEILVFWITASLLRRRSAEWLLLLSLVVTALRWQLTAWWPEQLAVVLFAQTLHMVTYGVYHAAAIQLIHRYFRGGLEARGQGLYSSVSFGLGGAIGAYLMGHAWEGVGAEASFAIASGIALLGFVIGWLGFRPSRL